MGEAILLFSCQILRQNPCLANTQWGKLRVFYPSERGTGSIVEVVVGRLGMPNQV
jgi:hypothetical protein